MLEIWESYISFQTSMSLAHRERRGKGGGGGGSRSHVLPPICAAHEATTVPKVANVFLPVGESNPGHGGESAGS